MTTIAELAEIIQTLLTTTADELARKTGFIERQRKVTGSGFAQALIFSFMADAASTRIGVNQTAATIGMVLSTPGLDKRFNGKAVYFLDSLLAEAVRRVVTSAPSTRSLLSRFKGVYVSDSTLVRLPAALRCVFRGSNGDTDATAKVAVQWELAEGALGLWLSDGIVHDQRTGVVAHALPAGALRLNDLGFFNLATFDADNTNGVYFFSRYKIGTRVYTADGQVLDLVAYLRRHGHQPCDVSIQLGVERLPCRLIAHPLSPEQVAKRRHHLREKARRKQQSLSERALTLAAWTLYVTNIPVELLTPDEAPILAATRWQIERLFDLWKTEGCLDETRSQDPLRVCCEFYAKLLTLLIQHWIMVVGCWHRLERSLHQATQVLRKRAFCLLDALTDCTALTRCLQHTAHVMSATCRLSKRAAHPLTFQLWLETAYG
jgi:hypothetical protein